MNPRWRAPKSQQQNHEKVRTTASVRVGGRQGRSMWNMVSRSAELELGKLFLKFELMRARTVALLQDMSLLTAGALRKSQRSALSGSFDRRSRPNTSRDDVQERELV